MSIILIQTTNLVQAKTSNLLFKETSERQIGTANTVLLGNQIIYQNIAGDEPSLWSYNTITNENTLIFTGQLSQFRFDDYIYVIDNHAYFASGNDFTYQFWKTDGTPSGTVQIDSRSLYPFHSQIDDLLFSWSNTGGLISTDGTEVFEHDIVNPLVDSICAYDYNDLIATKDGLSNLGDAVLLRSNNGVLTELSVGYPEIFEIRDYNSFRLGDSCYLLITGFEGFKEILIVPKDGPVKSLSEHLDISGIFRIMKFKDRVYAINRSEDGAHSIRRFNPSIDGFDAQFNIANSFTNASRTSTDFIIIRSTTPTASPPINTVVFLDQNLVPVEGLGGVHTRVPNIFTTANGDLFSAYSYVGNTSTHTLSDDASFDSDSNIRTTNSIVEQVITSKLSGDIFLQLRDKITGQKSVAEVADIPNINPSTAGLWFDPDINNQGLVINQGLRADGSDYLFVTVYTFIDGEPFWLAGVADIIPPQKSIQIELSQYSGGEFLQTDTPTEAVAWGQVELIMTSCNGLKATLTGVNDSSYVINLVRIDNTLFNNLCSD